ncbi:hypothetical protein [Frigidibacter sp. MR17.24]|uniref:hypothetical protein n=1 Tax=Frigidibacter sp. MR17.24 TaxID=3127345 RepID=UPI00301305C4
MKVSIEFKLKGETLYRHVFEFIGEDDLARKHALAFREFRERFPEIDLFSEGLVTIYDKA